MWSLEPEALDADAETQAASVRQHLLDELAKRHLSGVALLVLESCRPFSNIGSQAMAFFEPMVRIFLGSSSWPVVRRMLANGPMVDEFISRLEQGMDERAGQ